jgi:hypothetical protein
MHSLNHQHLAYAVAAERAQAAKRAAKQARLQHPPPAVRSRAAYATARVARRLDPKAARKAVA